MQLFLTDKMISELLKYIESSKIKRIYFYTILGKTGSGKDTILNRLKEKYKNKFIDPKVAFMKMHTTRPKRNESDNNYIFETHKCGFPLDLREHETVDGIWSYWFDVEDIVDFVAKYVNVKTLALVFPGATLETVYALNKLISNNDFNIDINVINIYIERNDKDRYLSLIRREAESDHPNLKELIRRIDSDDVDFPDEIIYEKDVIYHRIENIEIEASVNTLYNIVTAK